MKSAARSAADGSLPNRTLVPISQAEAGAYEHNVSRLDDDFASGFRQCWIVGQPPKQRMSIKKRLHGYLFPSGQFISQQRFEKLASND